MKVAAVIAEYNPFHTGHQYHLAKTRELNDVDYILVIMSGNFVQRGAPALLDKYTRTRMALLGGADAVIELPTIYATSSAEYFAPYGHRLRSALWRNQMPGSAASFVKAGDFLPCCKRKIHSRIPFFLSKNNAGLSYHAQQHSGGGILQGIAIFQKRHRSFYNPQAGKGVS